MIKLRRKIEKEEKDFVNKEKKSEVVLPRENFSDKKEKVKNYLEEAKNDGSNLDEEDEELVVE